MCCIFAVSCETAHKTQNEKIPSQIACLSPVNIRKFCNPPIREDVGLYISHINHTQLIDPDAPLMTAAGLIRTAIKNEIESGDYLNIIYNIGDLLKIHKTGKDILDAYHNSNSPVGISNLGIIDIPEQFGDIILETLHVSGAIHADVKILVIVTNFRQCLHFNFLYAEPYISGKRANMIAENTIKRLKKGE